VLNFNASDTTIDFKKKLKEKKVSLFATTCSLGQFDEKLNHKEFQSLQILSNGLQGKLFFYSIIYIIIYIHYVLSS
jgi:hypothetical protein